MAGRRGFLDETVDAALEGTRQTMTARVITSVANAVLMCICLGVQAAIVWLLAIAGCEAWGWANLRPLRKNLTLTRAERLNGLAAMAALTLVWSTVAVLYWDKHGEAFRLIAFCCVAGQLIHGQSMRSKAASFINLSIPAGVLIVLVAFLGDYHGTELLVVTVSVLVMIGYIVSSALANLKQSAALVAARVDASAADRAKSAFLATMSHEIRTPLNGLLGMAQALAAAPLLPGQGERLEVLHQSGKVLLAILNDLLDLSKIEAGKMEIESVEFDLVGLVEASKATFSAIAAGKGLGFELDMNNANGRYLGDPTRTRQILLNLISNAIKFTETGEIRIDIRYDTGELLFTITDTGMGMTPEAIDKLFAKFSQADASTTRQFGGTGLGLAICKQLAELMAGQISVTSRPGQGSVFVFRAPYVRVGEPSAQAPSERRESQSVKGRVVRVLAAEDNAINRLVLQTLLQQIDVEPVIVEDGQGAIEAWESGEWDVILMDIQMPVMDGISATRAIRARERATGRVRTPIVALTANGMRDQVAEYRACGMDGHVVKPIEASMLFEALESVLSVPGDVDFARLKSA